jgi:hypothetical protein
VRRADGPRARRAEHFRSGERADDANLRMPGLRRDVHEANAAGRMTVSEPSGDGFSGEHLSSEHRRALMMLAGSPGGCTELLPRAHGFRPDFVSQLVRAGLAAAHPSLLRGLGAQSTGIIVVTITAKGWQAIVEAGCGWSSVSGLESYQATRRSSASSTHPTALAKRRWPQAGRRAPPPCRSRW